jgi:hypothetical protein
VALAALLAGAYVRSPSEKVGVILCGAAHTPGGEVAAG